LLAADFFASQYGRLEVLSLCKLALGDRDARALARGLSFSVSRAAAGAGGGGWALDLGRGQRGGPPTGQLRRLLLADNFIGDDGCAALAAALRERDHACLDAQRAQHTKASTRGGRAALEQPSPTLPPRQQQQQQPLLSGGYAASPVAAYRNSSGGGRSGGSQHPEELPASDEDADEESARWLPEGLWELDLSSNRVSDSGAALLFAYLRDANGPAGARRVAWPNGGEGGGEGGEEGKGGGDDGGGGLPGPLGPPTRRTGSSLVRVRLAGNLVKDAAAPQACHLLRDFPYLEVCSWERFARTRRTRAGRFLLCQGISLRAQGNSTYGTAPEAPDAFEPTTQNHQSPFRCF
jgi:hypothetical protein